MGPLEKAVPVAEPRRRRDAQASRRALLDAAAALFDERGYDATTVREVGDRAGVDPALIARYFGGKEGLYLAALAESERPPLPADPHAAIGRLLYKGEGGDIGPVPLAMVSPRLPDAVREQVRELMRNRVTEPLAAGFAARGATAGEAALRAELLVALSLGVSLTRATGSLPTLTATALEDVLDALEPLVAALESTGS